jgi:hypothetical protein
MKPLLKHFNSGIKSIIDFIPCNTEGNSCKQGSNNLEAVKLSIIKDLKDSHHKMVQAIVEDEVLFQELKEKLRKERVVTNVAVVVLLHCTVLESMIPSVSSKASSPESNSSRHSTNNKMFLPLSRAIMVMQKFMIAFVSEERKKRLVADTQNFARMKDALDFLKAQPRRRSSSSYSATFIRNHSEAQPRRRSSSSYSATFIRNHSEEVNWYPPCNNRLLGKCAAYPTSCDASLCREESATVKTKPCGWTEETIQDLYEETLLRSRNGDCRKNIKEELREIEDVHSKSLGEIYEYYSRREHEKSK